MKLKSGYKAGFTLFELLVTMALMVALAGIGYKSLNIEDQAGKVERGIETIHSMARIARAQALTNATSARLIINFDPSDEEGFLRQIGIMIKDPAIDGHWIAVDRGAYLPKGVYVVPRSKVSFSDDWLTEGSDRKSIYKKLNTESEKDTAVYSFDYPLLAPVDENSSGATEWIVVQYAPNGRLEVAQYNGGGIAPQSNQIAVGAAHGASSALTFSDPEGLQGVGFKLGGATYTISNAGALGYEIEEGESE